MEMELVMLTSWVFSQEKILKIATEVYRADGVEFSDVAKTQLETLKGNGFGELPICMAKTQYSFSADPALKGMMEWGW